MAVLHRALCTWFICLIFLILLVLRLDERIWWSWFIVFIPMWLYDSILLLYLTFNLVTHCKRPHNRTFKALRRKVWNLTCAVLKLVAQIMLCLKLDLEHSKEHSEFKLPLYYVLIPVWIVLPVTVVDVFYTMYAQSNNWNTYSTSIRSIFQSSKVSLVWNKGFLAPELVLVHWLLSAGVVDSIRHFQVWMAG